MTDTTTETQYSTLIPSVKGTRKAVRQYSSAVARQFNCKVAVKTGITDDQGITFADAVDSVQLLWSQTAVEESLALDWIHTDEDDDDDDEQQTDASSWAFLRPYLDTLRAIGKSRSLAKRITRNNRA